MTNNPENEKIFEAILASAFRDAALADLEEAKKCEPVTFSSKHLRAQRRAYSKYKLRRGWKEITENHILRKSVAALLVICSVGFVALVSMPEVRAAVADAVVRFCDKYVSLDFTRPGQSFADCEYTFGYIPKGFRLADEYSDPLVKSYIFRNDSGEKFSITYSLSSMTAIEADNENSRYSEITINDKTAHLIENDAQGEVVLIFDDGDNVFEINGQLQKKDAVRIAEKISK